MVVMTSTREASRRFHSSAQITWIGSALAGRLYATRIGVLRSRSAGQREAYAYAGTARHSHASEALAAKEHPVVQAHRCRVHPEIDAVSDAMTTHPQNDMRNGGALSASCRVALYGVHYTAYHYTAYASRNRCSRSSTSDVSTRLLSTASKSFSLGKSSR